MSWLWSRQGEGGNGNERLSCSRAYDALWMCMKPSYQVHQIYLHGNIENCNERFATALACMRARDKEEVDASLLALATADDPKRRRNDMWVYRTKEEAQTFLKDAFKSEDENGSKPLS